jgi:hypothetical protein
VPAGQWAPVIDAVAVAAGDPQTAEGLASLLAELDTTSD